MAEHGDVDAVLRASRALLGVVARSVAPALESVTLPQFRVLVVLDGGGPLRVGLLADRLGTGVSTFSRTVDRLEAGGWVERTPSPESRREVTVSVTPAGSRLVQDVTSARRTELEGVLDRMSTSDRAALVDVLQRFADTAGEPALRDLLILGI